MPSPDMFLGIHREGDAVMDRDAVREIKDRIDIVEYIGETVPLRKAGRSFKGLCPFHSEKTPSFHVSSERQTYHCFGCGRGGDIFSFVMEREGLDFAEALSMLAERAGVRLERVKSGGERLKGVAGAMETALAFFRRSLLGPEGEGARQYLIRRGIPARCRGRFRARLGTFILGPAEERTGRKGDLIWRRTFGRSSRRERRKDLRPLQGEDHLPDP